MSNSDQAFINAYRRTSGSPTGTRPIELQAVTTNATGTVDRGIFNTDTPVTRSDKATWHYGSGPHVAFADPGVQPVFPDTVEADDESQAAAAADLASTVVTRFNWPALITDLVEQSPGLFGNLLKRITKSHSSIGFIGVAPGAGCTSTTLALAYTATLVESLTAVVDAAPNHAFLSEALGLIQSQTLTSSRITHRSAKDAIVHSIEDRLSVAIAGNDVSPTVIDGTSRASNTTLASSKSLLSPLSRTHELTLVDFGSGPDAFRSLLKQGSNAWEAWGIDGVVLVHCPDDGPTPNAHAQAMLEAIGAPLIGVVESHC